MNRTITTEATYAYREMIRALASGEDRSLAELLTVAAAAGKTTEDVTAEVDALIEQGDQP